MTRIERMLGLRGGEFFHYGREQLVWVCIEALSRQNALEGDARDVIVSSTRALHLDRFSAGHPGHTARPAV
jgi:hypothetical protein